MRALRAGGEGCRLPAPAGGCEQGPWAATSQLPAGSRWAGGCWWMLVAAGAG